MKASQMAFSLLLFIFFGMKTVFSQPIQVIQNDETIYTTAISYDGTILLAGGLHATLWDSHTGEKLKTIPDFSATCSAISHDNQLLAAAASSHAITIWSLDSGEKIKTLKERDYPSTGPDHFTAIAFMKTNDFIITGKENGNLAIWDINLEREIDHDYIHIGATIQSIEMSSDNNIFLVGTEFDAFLFSTSPFQFLHHFEGIAAMVSPDGRSVNIIKGFGDYSRIQLWDAQTGELKSSSPAFNRPANKAKMSRNTYFTVYWNNESINSPIHLQNNHDLKIVNTIISSESKGLTSPYFFPDSSKLAIIYDNIVEIYDLENFYSIANDSEYIKP